MGVASHLVFFVLSGFRAFGAFGALGSLRSLRSFGSLKLDSKNPLFFGEGLLRRHSFSMMDSHKAIPFR